MLKERNKKLLLQHSIDEAIKIYCDRLKLLLVELIAITLFFSLIAFFNILYSMSSVAVYIVLFLVSFVLIVLRYYLRTKIPPDKIMLKKYFKSKRHKHTENSKKNTNEKYNSNRKVSLLRVALNTTSKILKSLLSLLGITF